MKDGIKEILESGQFPGIRTSDTFGYKNHFYDPKTKTYIDSRSKWEKAGFRDPLDNVDKRGSNKHLLKEKIKEKKWKQRRNNA